MTAETGIARQVMRAITELKALQEPILSGEVAPDVLTEFRDALNRVRNSAWAAQQSRQHRCWRMGLQRWRRFWRPSESEQPINCAAPFRKMFAGTTLNCKRAVWLSFTEWRRAWWRS